VALIGYLGKDADNGIQFIVSRELFRTPKNLKWGGSTRYATHERHNTHALTEFIGLNPDQFSFDILLTAELGVDPLKEIVQIWDFQRSGEAVALVIGGKIYGKYRWNIVKHETKMEYLDKVGDMYAVEVSVELVEYLKQESTDTKRSAQPQNLMPVEARAAADRASGNGTSGGTAYTAKKGDNIWTIARKFLGSGADFTKLYETNREAIGNNPGLIVPGQTLTIPK